jgi:hydrophobic/amphiphilic exporter-1 (mainly G- bacteria), HAE1 family
MHITSLAIKRPITTIMTFAAVVLVGAISLISLPVDLLPDVDFPVLTVETTLPGYLPQEVETLITKPIEDLVSTLNHVRTVTSNSGEGLSNVRIEYNLGTNMDFASAEVREKINLIRNTFPKDVRNPIIRKYNPSDAPILIVSVSSSQSSTSLRELVENTLEKLLKRVDGVANVEIKGGKKREIVIEIDHGKLKALGIPIAQISTVLEQNNLNFQVGSIDTGNIFLKARTVGQFDTLKQIESIGIARTTTGSIIQIKDIAEVQDVFQPEENIARFQGEPRVMLHIQKESGANILTVSQRIKAELAAAQKGPAQSLELKIVYDQADFIEASIRRLSQEALFGGILAVMVIFLFLRNIQSVMIIAMAIPISVLAAFSMMYIFGISLNIISLAGFTLGVGMLVDNSIVVIENIFKKRQLISDRRQASIAGSLEVVRAVAVATVAYIAVFLPVFFLQEKIRMLYSGLFYSVSFSLLASLAVALTLIPALTSRLRLNPRKQPNKSSRILGWYRRILTVCLRYRGIVLGGIAVLFGCSLALIPAIGFEGMARMDRGEFNIVLRTPPGTRLAVTDDIARNAEKIVLKTPEVRDVSTEVTSETARLRVRLVSEAERSKSTRQVAEMLRPKVSFQPKTQVHFDIERRKSSGNELVLEISGFDQKKLTQLAFQVKQQLSQIGEISDVVIHQNNPKPELQIRVLHDKAGIHGLDATRIAHAVRSRLTGPLATEYMDAGKEIDLRVRLQEEDRKSFGILEDIAIPASADGGQGILVPLSEVSQLNLVQGMADINRKDRQRIIKLSAEVPDADLIQTIAKVRTELSKIRFPDDYGYRFGENYEELRQSRKEMLFGFALAVILVYMILASLFESFLYPFTIMFSVPMAIIGTLLILYLTGKSINVPVYLGAITLTGIAVNNAVVMVDYIKQLRKSGVDKWRAIIKGGENRLRPILMTSGTTLIALLPMALDKGEGSNLWSPLALTIIGGLFSATLLTLFVLPVLVSFIKDSGRIRKSQN